MNSEHLAQASDQPSRHIYIYIYIYIYVYIQLVVVKQTLSIFLHFQLFHFLPCSGLANTRIRSPEMGVPLPNKAENYTSVTLTGSASSYFD